MRGLRGNSAPAERHHHHGQSMDGSLSSNRLECSPSNNGLGCEESLLVEQLCTPHEEQLRQQQSQYEQLELKYRRASKEAARFREQRDMYKEDIEDLELNLAQLYQNYKHLKEDFRINLDEKYSLENEYKAMFSRYNYLVDKVAKPYAQIAGMKWNDQTAETIDVVVDKLAIESLEAGNLRDQVRVLQKEMLARVEKCDAIPDEQFAQDFRNLVASIKTLSRTILFTKSVDLVRILQTSSMLSNVDRRHWEGRARKKCMIEAWIWSVLLKSVFESPFSILGIKTTNLEESWQALFGAGGFHDWPKPSPLCETWRCTTIESIYGGVAMQDIIKQGLAKKKEELTFLEESILETRHQVSTLIETRLKIITPDSPFKHVTSIVDKALALAGQISTQRARLQIAYPEVGDKFDKQFMTPRSDANFKDLEDGSVAFIVNPGLIKWGDTHGKNLEHRYDIVPALVQLEDIDEIQGQTGPRDNGPAMGYADMVKQGM